MISENLRRIRNEQKLTQTELAKRCGFNRMSIVNIERHKIKDPKMSTISTLSKVLKVSADELIK